ncbi:SDR family oxidoreductase [uncultured Abyssibacter sp.]|uniref:SDR family oxidoreductase n=1 Tax=uncultured Abyssibacter sp. TaxID=2320202 RepID=UPI0032B10C3D
MSVLVIGCGDTGLRVARMALAAGRSCAGLVRTADSAARLRAEGVEPLQQDLDGESLSLPAVDAVVITAPPPKQGIEDARIARVLDALPQPARLVYISTSGVYGDCGGDWVDEAAPPRPITPRAQRRVDAENRLLAWAGAGDTELVRLRVPGIYGPGRLPAQRLRRGLPVIRPDEAPWSNRIHVEDLARVVWVTLTADAVEPVYNVSDGTPTTMTDYFLRCARHLGLPEPPQIPLADAEQRLGAQAASFIRESRRLDIRRLREGLGFEPNYPDLDAGILASIEPNSL